MQDDDGYFSAEVAQTYDAVHGGSQTTHVRCMVQELKRLACNGRALEFAIGTGRVALPLKAAGVEIAGIELSRAMVAELRKKAGGKDLDVTIGDMTTTQASGRFALVFLVYNTIDNLTSQEAQIACFRNAAVHLAPGGRFVVQTLVPPIQRLPFGERYLAFSCAADYIGTDEFDVVSQQYTSHHVREIEGEYRRVSIPFRYAWPAEMDVMARLAGLSLESRWADWDRSEFTSTSPSHVSVWKKP